jgi:hypothetical protein
MTRRTRVLSASLAALFLGLLASEAVWACPEGCTATYQNGALIGCDCSGSGGNDDSDGGDGDDSDDGHPGDNPTPAPNDPPGQPQPTPTPDTGLQEECYSCVQGMGCASGWAAVCIVSLGMNDWAESVSCLSAAYCEGSPPEESGQPEPPCVPSYGGGGIGCENADQWGYHIWVSARVPPHRVQVDPFPRWLVAMGAPLPAPFESGHAGRLTLQDYPAYTPPGLCAPHGPGFSAGCWSNTLDFPERDPEDDPQPGDVRDYHVGLRWRRVDVTDGPALGPVSPICWDFDEREWNVGADYGYGRIRAMECGATSVQHVYETSSWGKPHNGPRFVPKEEACGSWEQDTGCCAQVRAEWDMPAYQVRVNTNWSAEWAVEWEAWEQVGLDWGDEEACFCRAEGPPTGTPHQGCPGEACGGCAGWCGRIGRPTYDWVRHFDGWHTFDLRRYGSATWYYTSWAVITTGAAPWCAYEYGDPNPGDTVRVPVVEIQSVLQDPCVIDGSCLPRHP